jgi:demethylmenaquinone methyltransferase/2-methoxy-6-polyprenyl-1,4-benzoquinol methylase
VRPILARPDAVVLDLCCGTGDMTLALDHLRPRTLLTTDHLPLTTAPILAIDFSRNMLSLAQPKFAGRNIRAIEADALHLPFADASIDLVTCAFGFRNLASYPEGLAELYRVLRPSGQIALLDFNQPTGLMGALYNLYFKRVLPLLGRLISRDAAAYTYLPESVARFPAPPCMIEMIAATGFTAPTWTPYTFGIAGLYRAVKP